MAERRDEGFAGDLTRAVGRNRQQGTRRLGYRIVKTQVAVNRATRRKDHIAHTGAPHRLDDVECPDRAISQVSHGMVVAVDDVGVSRKMPN